MAINPSEVKDKFFIIEHGKATVLENFNYEFVRNILLKHYKPGGQPGRYTVTVVIGDGGERLGNWDVRQIDLDSIFFSNVRLNVQALMIEDITYESYRYDPNFPTPAIIERWQRVQAGQNRPDAEPEPQNLPEVQKQIPEKVYTREPIDANDSRITALRTMYPAADVMKVMDWVVNFETCLYESSQRTAQLSEEQLRIASVLQKCTKYVNSEVVGKISELLTEVFPDNRGFFGRLFKADVKFETPDADTINRLAAGLRTALSVNASQFIGAEKWFDDLIDSYQSHLADLNHGLKAGEYMVGFAGQDEMLLRRFERTQKMKVTANMSKMTVETAKVRFKTEMEKLDEIRDVLVPVLVSNLQSQLSADVDSDTVQMINRLKDINATKADDANNLAKQHTWG